MHPRIAPAAHPDPEDRRHGVALERLSAPVRQPDHRRPAAMTPSQMPMPNKA